MSKFTPTCLGFDAFRILCFPSFLVVILVVIQHPLSGSFSWSIGLRSNRTKCKCYTVCITSDERFLNLSILGTGDLRFLWHLHFWFQFRDSELASLAYQRFLLVMPLLYFLVLLLNPVSSSPQEKTLCLTESDIIALPYIVAVSSVAPGHSSRSQL